MPRWRQVQTVSVLTESIVSFRFIENPRYEKHVLYRNGVRIGTTYVCSLTLLDDSSFSRLVQRVEATLSDSD